MKQLDKILKDYKKYQQNTIYGNTLASYQKRVIDKKGTKYFINILVYDTTYNIETNIQLINKNGITFNINHISVFLEQFNSNILKQLEKDIDIIFHSLECQYYE